jgi:hypothetical protein
MLGYICIICGQSFKEEKELDEHLKKNSCHNKVKTPRLPQEKMTVKDLIWKMVKETGSMDCIQVNDVEARISIMLEDGEVIDFPIHDVKVGNEGLYIRNFPRDNDDLIYEEE